MIIENGWEKSVVEPLTRANPSEAVARHRGVLDDPHGRARSGARLEAEAFVVERRGGGRAQAGGLTERRELDLHRKSLP